MRAIVFGLTVAAALPAAVRAQVQVFRDTVTITPGARYARGAAYRFFFGQHYRSLWATPLRVPVVDLARFGGGLVPLQRGGGQQTKSLRFKAGDGRQYAFRSLDKDPSVVLPPDLRETFADRIFQDQISAGHPAGALVVPPILRAAGILHAEPVLVVLPDDPALGEYRADFGGLLGYLEERPKDADEDGMSFAGAKEIISTDKLLKELDQHPAIRVDSREFLLARLTDVFLGDWDRHRDQWRWARFEDARGERFVPIPRDRDQAFVRFDGFLFSQIRTQIPQLVNFGAKYSAIVGATWNGRDLDRRFLTDLERPAWDSVARVLQARITDQVIDEAVGQLPAEYRSLDAARLRAALRARREGIPAMAIRYYRHLATQVDIIASDKSDVALAHPVDGNTVEVSVRRAGVADPYYRRRFHADETEDIRIYLQGDRDSAVVSGDRSLPISVRVVGGGSDDRFVNQGEARAKFYDTRGENSSEGGGINTKRYVAIEDSTNPTALPARDWGRRRLNYPVVLYGPDAGFLVGWAGRFTDWGFRKKPFASKFRYGATFATGAATGRLAIDGRWQRENSRSYLALSALASGLEVLRWHGFGNETTIDPTRSVAFYRATQHQVSVAPSVGWALSEQALVTLGPRFKYSVTVLDDGKNRDRFIGIDRPFGSGNFAQAGFGAELTMDTRNSPLAATRGVNLELGASTYPKLLDVKAPFGEVHGRVSTYLSPKMPGSPTLALQVGGKKIFGTVDKVPFHEAAFLGSNGTLRGYRTSRFAGDAGAILASAELRVHLTNAFIFVPGRQGIATFYDAGRVYWRGERSTTWHQSWGAGVWFAFLAPANVVTALVGHSDEGTKVYAKVGFAF